MRKPSLILAALCLVTAPARAQDAAPESAPSPNAIIDMAPEKAWVRIPASDVLVMTLEPGPKGDARTVIIQLMPVPFSQGWVENIRTFARAKWYDGITVNRVQDNYVVQWGDPNYDNPEAEGEARALPDGLRNVSERHYSVVLSRVPIPENAPSPIQTCAAEDTACLSKIIDDAQAFRDQMRARQLRFPNDPYSHQTRFADGWPVATDLASFQAWPVHCYGMVGVGRGYSPDTGSGAELYTVIGHAPRHLDRNIALVGRIVEGMEHLSSLPRGSGALGFYTEDEFGKRTPIVSVRIASDLPDADQPAFEYLSTESDTFARYADARANRRDPFFILPAGGADICNIPVPVRRTADAAE
ncbi:peptidylprolyl isomerase [Pontixanthobacter sp.]|uniref:peptidylprolyl isomerase n=1 Tax=Pontixanthobacter sp. TaxID=2792078 RepID=UPI003C7D2DB4